MITHLEMLPLLLECDGTITPFGRFLARLVSLLHSLFSFFVMSYFALGSFNTMYALLSHLLFYTCNSLVDNTYPKEYRMLKHRLFVQIFFVLMKRWC